MLFKILPDNIYNFSKSDHEGNSDQKADNVSTCVVGCVGGRVGCCGCCYASSTG